MFSPQQFDELCTMQETANDLMSDDWRESTNEQIAYYRAAYLETSESIEHLGWKWWKKPNPNYEQAFLEIVDVLHFCLSEYIRQGRGGEADFLATALDLEEGSAEFYFIEAENFMMECLENQFASVYDWVYLVHAWNRTYPEHAKTFYEIFEIYLAKNTLNIFRTKNGQREGTYYKIWDGQEDNVHMHKSLDYLKSLGALSYANLYQMLNEQYTELSDDQKEKA